MGHEERAHAILSASGAHRWLACTPSALLEQQFPDTASDSAREGTLAHELAELKLRNYFFTLEFGKRKLTAAINELKKEELWQEEMDTYTEEYLDYIKAEALRFQSAPHVDIEKRVNFGTHTLAKFGKSIVPTVSEETEGRGIADCILTGDNTIHVIDFKYGKSPDGRVKAERNPQLMLYALGAYEAYKLLYPITTIALSIVQPRLSDGITKWTCSLEELLEFGSYVQDRAKLAWTREGEYVPSAGTCKWCRAKANCRARAEENARLVFAVDKKPPLLSNEEVGQYLSQGEDVAKWLKGLQEYALKECLAGKEVPGWKAVEGRRGTRNWSDVERAFTILQEKGIPEAILYERKPLTPAQAEKAVGKQNFADWVGGMMKQEPGKPALVPAGDSRPALKRATVKELFQIEE